MLRRRKRKEKRLEDKIKEFIVARLNLPTNPADIGDEQRLFGEYEGALGLDSIDALELATGVKAEFGVIIEEDIDPAMFTTVKAIADFIRTEMADLIEEYADYEVM
jgi:acyl carrier protein